MTNNVSSLSTSSTPCWYASMLLEHSVQSYGPLPSEFRPCQFCTFSRPSSHSHPCGKAGFRKPDILSQQVPMVLLVPVLSLPTSSSSQRPLSLNLYIFARAIVHAFVLVVRSPLSQHPLSDCFVASASRPETSRVIACCARWDYLGRFSCSLLHLPLTVEVQI